MNKMPVSSIMSFHHRCNEDLMTYLEICFEKHKKMGFKGIDFNTFLVKEMGRDREKILSDICLMAQENGLYFPQCHLPFVSQKTGTPDQIDGFYEQVCNAIDAAKILGAEYAVMHPNSTTIPMSEFDAQEQYDLVMNYLSPFVNYAEKVGVKMVIENMRVVHKEYPTHRYGAFTDELCKIVDALGVGVCWDTGHAHITGLKQSEALCQIGSRLKVLHLNDNLADDDIHLAPFMGTIDWTDVMYGLKKIGYGGALNFEVSGNKIPELAMEEFGKYIYAAGCHLLEL